MEISFNLRVDYNQSLDCIKKIRSLGGDGNITRGGSWYSGTSEQIDGLLAYMSNKGYDLKSLSISNDPYKETQKKVELLKRKGIIE